MKNKIFALTGFEFFGNITETDFDGVYVSFDGKDATLGFKTLSQKARAYFLLSMKAKNGAFEIKQKPCFDTLGPMLDMSRSRVMTVDGVCRFIDNIAALGMNMIMLYTEDTYEVEGEPFFGYMRGRYSADELKEIDEYASSMGIELVGCVQTLGHLEQVGKWKEFKNIFASANTLIGVDARFITRSAVGIVIHIVEELPAYTVITLKHLNSKRLIEVSAICLGCNVPTCSRHIGKSRVSRFGIKLCYHKRHITVLLNSIQIT